jgi:hypothetical protein
MAIIRSSYPTGASETEATRDGFDPTLYLQALLQREAQGFGQRRFKKPARVGGGKSTARPSYASVGGEGSGGGGELAPGAAPTPTTGAGGLTGAAGVTPRSLGRHQMNHMGNWGTFVDPADIPAGLQDTIMGGFYGQAGNWDSSNPSILGPQQWKTGKYTHNGSVNFPSAAPGGGDSQAPAGEDWAMAFFRQFGRLPDAGDMSSRPPSR